jgi:triacylglycerol esterase/lipase EstA (alpha/beta hydrolase family)
MRMRIQVALFCLALTPIDAAGAPPFFAAPLSPPEMLAHRPLRTRYPVLLAHGIMGFRALVVGGVNFGNYFRGVEDHLRDLGVVVFADRVGMTNGVPQRAAILKKQLEELAWQGKVNIIAHSLGGLDSRYAIGKLGLGDRVASLTTVGTPHRGTYVADWAVEYVGRDLRVRKLLEWAGVPSDAFEHLTTEWVEAMNRELRDDPRVRCFSVGGSQSWYEIFPGFVPFHLLIRLKERVAAGLEPDPDDLARAARLPHGDVIVDTIMKEREKVRMLGATAHDRRTYAVFRGDNDGLVPVSSTPWGEAFQVVGYDHLDQIGWFTTRDTPTLYEGIVRRLAELGY